MRDIRSALVRGPYHRRLVGVILQEIARQEVTQDSLAVAVDMHQTTVGGILKQNGGTFDLDEADAALRHVGSSLKEFIADPANAVMRPRESVSKVARQLANTLRGMTDAELRMMLNSARLLRAARRTRTRSARRHAAAPAPAARKTGGTR